MLRKHLFLIMFSVLVISFIGLWMNSGPLTTLPSPPNSIDEALKLIEAGEILIEHEIFFPIYMNRFKVEVINTESCKQYLPLAFHSSNKAVKITDSKTGHAWISNGCSPYLRIS